jgi:septal ring factor EnvC (AmiA/AmiB activator)
MMEQSFRTLYGHLSEDSLEGMVVGREVAAGERIGSIGSSRGQWRVDAAPPFSGDSRRSAGVGPIFLESASGE